MRVVKEYLLRNQNNQCVIGCEMREIAEEKLTVIVVGVVTYTKRVPKSTKQSASRQRADCALNDRSALSAAGSTSNLESKPVVMIDLGCVCVSVNGYVGDVVIATMYIKTMRARVNGREEGK